MSLNRIVTRALIAGSALIAAGGLILAQQPAPPAQPPARDPHANEVPAPKSPPRVVTPGKELGAPPSDAIVLFDGKDASAWESEQGGRVPWTVADGAMTIVPGSKGIRTRQRFCDIQLHVEWRTPTDTKGIDGQNRGNSGIFLQEL